MKPIEYLNSLIVGQEMGSSIPVQLSELKMLKTFLEIAETPAEGRAALAQPAQPVAKFDDPRVQAVYALLSNPCEQPPEGERWEVFAARRIVDVLQSAQQQIHCECGRTHKLTNYGWASTEPAQSLTDAQMWAIWNAQGAEEMNRREAIAFARAIESAIKGGGL